MLEILTPVRLLGLPGSLRKASFSRATLIGLRDNLPEKVTLEIHEPQLPLYNEDDDRSNGPDQVTRFRNAIANSDGVVIVTPEYNHGVPGVLKNALDWASRPLPVRADKEADIGDIGFARLHGRRTRARTAQ
jgi:chromate reductase